jgi:sec-independent protein translocase protein TatA
LDVLRHQTVSDFESGSVREHTDLGIRSGATMRSIAGTGRRESLMGRIGIPELLVILFIVILIFGASRLPELGKGIGKGIKNFKEATREGANGKSDT